MSNATGEERSSSAEGHTDALAHLRSIFDTVREPLLVLDRRFQVCSANRSFYRMFRVSPPETEGRLLYELGNGQWDIPRLRTLLEEILPHDTAFDDFEVEHDFPDIGRKVMLLNARRLRQEGGELILLALDDVTERRRAEVERQEIETRFTSRVKSIKDHVIFTLDPEGQVTSWNVAAEHILGYTEDEALGRHFSFMFTPEDRKLGLPEAELRAAREQGLAEDERWHLRKDGERFWALGIVSALHDIDGRLTGFSKILRDLTDWKRAEQALQESEQRLRRMLNVDGVGVLIFDGSGTLLDANDAFLRMSGHGRDEVEARALTWRVLTPPEHVAESERQMRLLGETGRIGPYEKEYFRKDGSRSWMVFAGASLGDGTFVKYCVDVDNQRRAEEALRQSEQRLRMALDMAYTVAYEWDIPRNEVWRQHSRMGALPETPEERPSSLEEVCAAVHPDDRESFLANLDAALAHPERGYRGEFRLCEPDGRIVWLAEYGYLECDAQGQPQRLIGLSQDITERKRAEKALQEASRHKDAFLATLAHELRNPLAPIRTGLDLIEALRGDASACEEPIRMMDRQLKHLVRLVDDLLDVSRISRGKIGLRKERLDLAEIIDAAREMSDSELSQGDRQLTVSVPSEPLAVEGDRMRLVQILANLLNNAAKFTDVGGRIDLSVTPRGEQVEIRVHDDGCGIPRERLDKIFEMFSQAEPGLGSGLGIGLSLVRGLVEMHGGTVCADSEGSGRGATFTVVLPLCRSAPVQPTADEATELGPLPTKCRVLVVDDNRDIAKSLQLLLTMMGAEVRVAHDGAEAVRIVDDWPPTHVLMDLGMPGMDGYEAARQLRAKHPDSAFRLVAMTGWGQEEDRQRVQEAGFDEHLVKPMGVAELKAVLSS